MQTQRLNIIGSYWHKTIVHDPNICAEFAMNIMFVGFNILKPKTL
jgi:hypothetical protein